MRSLFVMVLGLVDSAAMAEDRRGIRFWNLTLYTITDFQMSPAGALPCDLPYALQRL